MQKINTIRTKTLGDITNIGRNVLCNRVVLKGLVILSIIMLSFILPVKSGSASNVNNYLVLIQNKDKTWTAYENLIEKSSQGNLMVKAKNISEALNFTYNNYGSGIFTIQKGNYRYNTYTKGDEIYKFRSSSSLSVDRKAAYAPYTSAGSNSNVCHVSTLKTLINYRYFTGSQARTYKEEGYQGVVCYSLYGTISNVPSINSVINSNDDILSDAELNQENGSSEDKNDEEDGNKLILVGDSRTNNMSQWVDTSTKTEFIAKSGKGYQWFVDEGIDEVNSIKNPGDSILIWLGVNDYNSNNLGGAPWMVYANKINSLVKDQWSDCKVYVAQVGYVDSNLIYQYYGRRSRTNTTQLDTGYPVNGICEFNLHLKNALDKKITWVDTSDIIGIQCNDYEQTPTDLWVTRSNGKKDGLHYGEKKSQEIYDYFVEKTR